MFLTFVFAAISVGLIDAYRLPPPVPSTPAPIPYGPQPQPQPTPILPSVPLLPPASVLPLHPLPLVPADEFYPSTSIGLPFGGFPSAFPATGGFQVQPTGLIPIPFEALPPDLIPLDDIVVPQTNQAELAAALAGTAGFPFLGGGSTSYPYTDLGNLAAGNLFPSNYYGGANPYFGSHAGYAGPTSALAGHHLGQFGGYGAAAGGLFGGTPVVLQNSSELSARYPWAGRYVEPVSSNTDQNTHCGYWAGHGECTVNPAYMLTRCAVSCAQLSHVGLATSQTYVGQPVPAVSAGAFGPFHFDGQFPWIKKRRAAAAAKAAKSKAKTKKVA